METEEQRKEVEAETAEGGVALQERWPRQDDSTSTTTTITITGSGLSSEPYGEARYLVERGDVISYQPFELKSCDCGTSHGHVILDVKRFGIRNGDEINLEDEDTFKNKSIPNVPPLPSKDTLQEEVANDVSINMGTTELEEVDIAFTKQNEQKGRDLYLETVYKKPDTCDFYSPKCKACINKVLIHSRDDFDEVRCPSCFEFLRPIGDWFFQKPVPIDEPGNKKPIELKPEDTVHRPLPESLTPAPPKNPEQEGTQKPAEPEVDDAVHPPSSSPEPLTYTASRIPEQEGAIKWEILKSIVYGGLSEAITSLSVVTSAASADAATLNIVALAFANLVGGLFVTGHNLWELKKDQSRVTSSETDEQVDRYQELLGQRRNFILHASVAVLSFLVFGLVPPIVYGFSFYESDNRHLKVAAVAAASLLCITVLAIAKAYTQKPPKLNVYLRTVLQYVALGVAASGISYLAGYLIRKLIEKFGWFE